nr:MAG: protein of unknown function DUF3310 [Bacteriophage sp.]
MSSYVKCVGDLSVPEEELVEAAANTGFNPVTKPLHYAGHTGIECKQAMESMLGTDEYVSYMQGCAFKYLWRWKSKNGIEDLKKAHEYIENMLEALEGGAS